MKLQEAIKRIKASELAIENDLEFLEAIKVLNHIFPQDDSPINSKLEDYTYYSYTTAFIEDSQYWSGIHTSPIPTIKASELLIMIEGFNPKFGDKVLAWNEGESEPKEMIYLGNDDGYLMCCLTKSFRDIKPVCKWFDNIKPIPRKTKVTLQQIADWKNVSPDDIEIV